MLLEARKKESDEKEERGKRNEEVERELKADEEDDDKREAVESLKLAAAHVEETGEESDSDARAGKFVIP